MITLAKLLAIWLWSNYSLQAASEKVIVKMFNASLQNLPDQRCMSGWRSISKYRLNYVFCMSLWGSKGVQSAVLAFGLTMVMH